MSVNPLHRLHFLLTVTATGFSLGACSTMGDSTRSALSAVTPYKVEVQQGNFISKEQVDALKAGMTRQQAREILGTSLMMDVFHADRWDYVFTIRRQGLAPMQRRLTLFFNGEVLERFEGDPMPTEEEFVDMLDTRSRSRKTVKLEATEEELKKFAPAADKAPEAPAQPLPPLPAVYPPLEASR
jgi:outer membrane protein assembly factor BamE